MERPPESAHEGYPFNYMEVGVVRGKKVKIITRPLTKEETRIIFLDRPFSKYAESRFGGDDLADDKTLVLNSIAVPCKMCKAATRKGYVLSGTCPDCDGRSEANGKDPHRAKECCGNCNSD